MERNALNLIMLNYQRTCTGSFPIVIVTVVCFFFYIIFLMEKNALNFIMLNYHRTCPGGFPIVIVTVVFLIIKAIV